ncbi:MAG: sulfite exporter TauE/SafE family protein, partial [Comamonas sp.]
MLDATWMAAAAVAVFALAGLVKGVVGLGLPTVSMALLALFMPPAQAAALLLLPSLVSNVMQMRPTGMLRPLLARLG